MVAARWEDLETLGVGVLDRLGGAAEREEEEEAGVSKRRAATADFQSVFKLITGKLGV